MMRVLYSFPHKIGAARICMAAWKHVAALQEAGAEVSVHPGAVARRLPEGILVRPTLARGKVRVPYRALGHLRALVVHDHIVARRLSKLAGEIDVVHTWPSGALDTLRAARRLGIPTVLERPNAHTRYAYDIVRLEGERLGVTLPPDHEHAFDEKALAREEREFELADRLLCPSEFVRRSFIEQGFAPERLAPHTYGYDANVFFPAATREPGRPFTLLFAGGNPLRKGLHYALEAWLRSPAHRDGVFLVLGNFPPGYAERIAGLLEDPSIHVLGYRSDYPEILKQSDALVLPTVEEGSPLVCVDALACGVVPVVSDVCEGVCRHMENALVHKVGDVDALSEHITQVSSDAALYAQLRAGALSSAPFFTWESSGARLLDVYREVVASGAEGNQPPRP